MSKGPKLEVPQASQGSARSGLSGLVFVLLLILLVVSILQFFINPTTTDLRSWRAYHPLLTVDQLKEAAIELEQKNVSTEAAALWMEYLEQADLASVEAGKIRARIGDNLRKAGQWSAAFAEYVRAEILLGEGEKDLAHEVGLHRMECLRKMGQFSDLSREIAERASDDGESDLDSKQIVAEVDGEKITVVDFERMLSQEIELAVKSRMGLSPEEEDAMRKRAHEQFRDPQVRAQQLQQFVSARVLAAEARSRKLDRSEAFRERLVALADGILSSTLLHEEIAKRATVTDADIERYFAAHRADYDEPPATFIAHILCRDEAHARDLIAQIDGGASFDKLARSESLDDATRETMGILATPVPADGDFVPLFGSNQALHDVIRDAEASAVLPEPYQSDRGWHVLKVVSHRERIERPLDEIRDRVAQETAAARRREVTQQYLAELFDRYDVSLYPEAFVAGAGETESPADAPTP